MAKQAGQRTLAGRIARNTGMLFGGKTTGAVIGLLVLVILGNSLAPDQFGALLLLHAYAASFTGLASFNSWQMVVNYGVGPFSRGETERFQGLLRFAACLDGLGAVVSAVLAMLALPFLYKVIGLPDGFLLPGLGYCALIFFNQKSASTGLLRVSDRFDLLSWHALIMPAARLIGVSVCALMGAGFGWYVLVWFIAAFLSYVTLPVLAIRELSRLDLWTGLFSKAGAWPKAPEPGLWRFALFSNLDSTAKVAGEHVPTLLAGAIFGPAAAPVYRISRQIADLFARGVSQFDRVLHPEIARLMEQGEFRRVMRLAMRSSVILMGIGIAMAALLALADVDLLSRLLGEGYRGGATLIVLLLVAASLMASAMPFHPILYACRRPSLALAARLCGVAVLLSLVPVIAGMVGLDSLGWAAIAGELVALILVLGFAHRSVQLRAGQRETSTSLTDATMPASDTPEARSGGPDQPASGKTVSEKRRSPE